MSELEKYVRELEKDLAKANAQIASATRTKSRLEEKLSAPAAWLEKEFKRGTRKARISKGEEVVKRSPPVRKTETSPAPEVTPPPEKKKSWL